MTTASNRLPRRILLVRLGALGDVVNALVLAEALKRADPEVWIGWAAHELVQPLLDDNPCVDHVHLWPRAEGLPGMLALAAELEGAGYELAIDLQRIAKSALLARASRAPRVLGFDRARCKEGSWWAADEHLAPADPGAPMVEQYLEFGTALGIDARYRSHPLPRDAHAEAWAQARVAELGAAPLLISLGASKPDKRWPEPRMGEAARALAQRSGLPIVLTGSKADRALHAPSLELVRGLSGVQDLVGATSVRELYELQRRARLVLSCDTGPMHLAAAVGTRVLALFGPKDPRRTGPWSALPGRHQVLRAPSQKMADLALGEVLEAARAMLGE